MFSVCLNKNASLWLHNVAKSTLNIMEMLFVDGKLFTTRTGKRTNGKQQIVFHFIV